MTTPTGNGTLSLDGDVDSKKDAVGVLEIFTNMHQEMLSDRKLIR